MTSSWHWINMTIASQVPYHTLTTVLDFHSICKPNKSFLYEVNLVKYFVTTTRKVTATHMFKKWLFLRMKTRPSWDIQRSRQKQYLLERAKENVTRERKEVLKKIRMEFRVTKVDAFLEDWTEGNDQSEISWLGTMLSKKWPILRWEDHTPSRRDNQPLCAMSV